MRYVTQEGMSTNQPGCSVGYLTPANADPSKTELHVTRYYPNIFNKFGGKGVCKKLDAYGMLFDDVKQAQAYAAQRGYIRPYFKKRERRRI